MKRILLITSSPRGEASYSTRAARAFADRLAAAPGGAVLVHRDLALDPPPHIGPDFVQGLRLDPATRTAAQAAAIAYSDEVIDEIFAADTLVIAAGLINFGVPSTLKAWIDYLARAGRTFVVEGGRPRGLFTGHKVYLVTASGGIYSQGPMQEYDHLTPYLRQTLGFLGLIDLETVPIEGTAYGEAAAASAYAAAEARFEAVLTTIGDNS